MNKLEGFLLINKPTGITSYCCINKLKYTLGFKTKIGHTGTLDSFATGLLIIAIGRAATRNIEPIMRLDKWYTATGKLGELSNTLDFTGKVIEHKSIITINKKGLKIAIQKIGKQYKQIPPIYSALKYKGQSLSNLAREAKLSDKQLQKIAIKKTKKVTIYSCELLSLKTPFFTIKTHVSHGTYIRTLVNDIAKKAGTIATTHKLDRKKIGPFTSQKAKALNNIKTIDDINSSLISIDNMLQQIESYNKLEL